MEHIWGNLLLALLLWLGNYVVYLTCNHGIAPNARLQQFLRYLPASIVAVMPLVLTDTTVLQPAVLKLLLITELWALAYPLTYHLSFHKKSPDYDHQIDIAFGIYLFGIMSGLAIMLPAPFLAIFIVTALAIPLFLLGYYAIYLHVIDIKGMLLIQQTNYNEVIEFFKSYPLWKTIAGIIAIMGIIAAFVFGGNHLETGIQEGWTTVVISLLIVAVAYYMFKPRHGLFVRTGLAKLYLEVREYTQKNSRYAANRQERMQQLKATCTHPLKSPHTFLLVIGESASRDFMSSFTKMEEDTTPWLRELSGDRKHCVLFPHAYSCDIQTVPTLEKALTAFNQYDGGHFYSSYSIIDMAHCLGYKVHWYSNQGHLGSADTPITLVAETADVAKWTEQQVGKNHYDDTLIDFLEEVDPESNNLVVLHLKGSHFNYENRFKEAYRQWGTAGSHDQITNYKNTLYFTDSVLQRVFDSMRQQLNLQGMVYCSDHADVPDRHRQPNFGGFRDTRIPLAVWMSDEYINCRPERAADLRGNHDKYWTNDLLFDLICGFLDVESEHFKEENSLASHRYRFEREQLTAMNGTIRIAEDNGKINEEPSR
jgi:heptose-I-phosphate ethanolaminephosphotransferase